MMPAVLAIWRQPIAERRAMGNLGLSWCLLALFVLATLSWRIDSPHRNVLFAAMTSVPMGALLILWWTYLCRNVRLQCHPAAMGLVPGLRRRVVQAVLLAWVIIIAIMTLLAGVPTGYAPQVALVTALVLVELSYAGTWRGMVLGPLVVVLASSKLLGIWLAGFLLSPTAMLVGIPLLVLDGAVAIRRLGKPAPGAVQQAVTTGFLGQPLRGYGGRSATWFDRGADPQPAFLQPLGRSWFGGHWPGIALLALVCAGLRVRMDALGGTDAHAWFAIERVILAIAMVAALAVLAWLEAQRFATGRTEQALLCLTPAAPERNDMNRVLARGILAGFLRSWLTLWLVTMAAQTALGATWSELARLSAVWLAALGLLVLPMRDFARATGSPGFLGALCCAILAGAGAGAVSSHDHAAAWLALAGAGLLTGLVLACWRWQVLLAAAPALPAGRVLDRAAFGRQ